MLVAVSWAVFKLRRGIPGAPTVTGSQKKVALNRVYVLLYKKTYYTTTEEIKIQLHLDGNDVVAWVFSVFTWRHQNSN